MPKPDRGLRLERIAEAASPHIAELISMLLATPSFLWQTQGRLPTAHDGNVLFQSLPADAQRSDKFLWGAWSGREMVGCLEVIRHSPRRDCACIGLIVVVERLQRRGVGAEMLQLARQSMRAWPGVRRICLAVAENNPAALAFWRHAGYRDSGLREHRPDFKAQLIVMERPLT